MTNLTRDELSFMEADRAKLLEDIGDMGHNRNFLIIQGVHYSGFKAGLEYCRQNTTDERLKAAAPELLATLKAIIETCNVRIDDPRIAYFDKARALIAQIEGEATNEFPAELKRQLDSAEYAAERVNRLRNWYDGQGDR